MKLNLARVRVLLTTVAISLGTIPIAAFATSVIAPGVASASTCTTNQFSNTNGSWQAGSGSGGEGNGFFVTGCGVNTSSAWEGHIEISGPGLDSNFAGCSANNKCHAAGSLATGTSGELPAGDGCSDYTVTVWEYNNGSYTNQVSVTGLMFC